MAPITRTPVRARLAGLLTVVIVLGVAACTPEEREDIANQVESAVDAAQSAVPDEPDTEAPATEAQETEEAATEEPATEEPATEEPETEDAVEESDAPVDDADDTNWIPWLIAALVALALLALIFGAIGRRRDARRSVHARISEDLGDIIGTGRWILDQGTTEALRLTDPSQLERSWQSTRQQMIGMEEDLSRMLVDAQGDPLSNALKSSSEASAGLRSAVDADVARRLDPSSADDPALAQSMRDTVQERRTHFRETLDRLATFR
ncbi:hypothetical protein [Salsipaludibacter albus]|uniref:hypothetical protein n=1 Tax=Salsipaludibacter albus TaxID=2849650 RepID=UPI001EE3CC2B|nr:hypothetical protein [Salsipaludibacter albus]MBY5162710.1 hypothetical protein [Salsipaludibacter albus]